MFAFAITIFMTSGAPLKTIGMELHKSTSLRIQHWIFIRWTCNIINCLCHSHSLYIYIYIFRTLKLAYRVNWTCYSNVIEKFCSIFCSLLLIVSSVLWIYFSILYSLYSCLVAACILRCPTSFPNINAHIDRVLNWDRGRLDEYWFRDFSQTCSCA